MTTAGADGNDEGDASGVDVEDRGADGAGPGAAGTDTGADANRPARDPDPDGDRLLVRERRTPEGLLVSVCDPECVGETFADGDVSLEVTEEFYGGADAERVGPEAAVDSLYRATTANIVGERAVAAAVEAGVVDEERVLDVGGTRHAQLLWM